MDIAVCSNEEHSILAMMLGIVDVRSRIQLSEELSRLDILPTNARGANELEAFQVFSEDHVS
jgi:hypothetical protein